MGINDIPAEGAGGVQEAHFFGDFAAEWNRPPGGGLLIVHLKLVVVIQPLLPFTAKTSFEAIFHVPGSE